MNATAAVAATAEIVRRDLEIFTGQRTRFASQVLAGLLTLTLFFFLSRLVGLRGFSPDQYFAFAAIGLILLRVVTSVVTAASSGVQAELSDGTLQPMLLSPFGGVAGVAAGMLFPFAVGFAVGGVMLALAIALFGLEVQWSTIGLALPVALLTAPAVMPFALLLAAATLRFRQVVGVTGFLITGVALSSGLYFPTEILPASLTWVTYAQPLTPAVELLRHVVIGIPLERPAWAPIAILAAFAVVLTPPALLVLRAAVRARLRLGALPPH